MPTTKPNDDSTQPGSSEFFLVQTEVESTIVALGTDYDEAWLNVLEGKSCYMSCPPGASAEFVHEFKITIHYEPGD